MDNEAAIREAYKQQKHKKCVELIDSASDVIRHSSQYKILKASCLNNIAGQSKVAHQILDEVISSDPLNAFAFYGKGLLFINEAKLEKAVEFFDRAIKLEPGEKMEKAQQMKARVLNMMSPKKAQKKVETAPKVAVKKPELVKTTKIPHTCTQCNKSFEHARNLDRHMLTHTGERPFSCEVCQRRFTQKSDLNRHLTAHSNVANFTCTVCGKKFKTQKNLQCHTSRHTTDFNFKCKQCGKGFITERSLSYHTRAHKNKKMTESINLNNEIKKEVSSPQQESSDLFEEVQVKDEFEEFKMEVKTEDNDYSDDGIISSQSLTFGELEPMTEDDSDWSFCVSLLNDLSKMDEKQKMDFRTKTQQTLKEILN